MEVFTCQNILSNVCQKMELKNHETVLQLSV